VVVAHLVSVGRADQGQAASGVGGDLVADSCDASDFNADNDSGEASQGADSDAHCPLCSRDFSQWSEVSRNANTKLHMRYSHALDWNPKSGQLRALVLPPNIQKQGAEETSIRSLSQVDDEAGREEAEDADEERGLYQMLKPAKGEKFHATNLRLNVTIGKTVGWYRRAAKKEATQKEEKDFPECLPSLFKETLSALKKDVAAQRLRVWLIPSISKSISLCIDLLEQDRHASHAELLRRVSASSSADVLAKVSSHLHTAMIAENSDRDQAGKRSADECDGDDDGSVFLSAPSHVGFLKCKDHASHSKLSDFVQRSIIRFLGDWLSCVARKQLPSIQMFSNEYDAPQDDSAEGGWGSGSSRAKINDQSSDDHDLAEEDSASQAQVPRGRAGRRRTMLFLAASHPEMCLDYARLLKVASSPPPRLPCALLWPGACVPVRVLSGSLAF